MQTTTNNKQQEAIARARRYARVFSYDSSKADKRYFRNGIVAWLQNPDPNKLGWRAEMTKLVHDRNDGGKTAKYCYFNDTTQRIYLDRDFEAWAKEAIKAAYTALCQLQTK